MTYRNFKAPILDENGQLFIDHSNVSKYRELIETIRKTHYQVENNSCIESEGFYAIYQAIRNGKRFPSEEIATYELRLIIKRRVIDYLRSAGAGREWLIASEDFDIDESLDNRTTDDMISEDSEEEVEIGLILNFFNPTERKYLSLKIEGMSDNEIAAKLDISRFKISEIRASVKDELERIVTGREFNTHLLDVDAHKITK